METNPAVPPVLNSEFSLQQPLIKQGWARAVVFLFAWIVIQILMELISYLIFDMGDSGGAAGMSGTVKLTMQQAVQLLSTLLAVLVFRKLIDRRSVKSLGFSIRNPHLADLGAGILLGLVLMLVMVAVLILTGQAEFRLVGFDPVALCWLVLLMVLVAFNEEIAVRGYLLNNLLQSFKRNRWAALLLTAGFFSLLHLMNPNMSWVGFVNILLAGLVLGLYYLHRGNLWFPIGLHFSWNFFQGPVFGSPVSGKSISSLYAYTSTGDELITGGAFGLEASILSTILLILALVWIHYKYRPQKSADPVLPDSASPANNPNFP